jgi:putative transposase
MVLNPAGEIIAEEWLRTSIIRPNIELDEFTIIPNHLHAILVILPDASPNIVRAMRRIAPTTPVDPLSNRSNLPNGAAPGSIGAIIGQIKSITTKRINRSRNTPGAQVWQRNYYEHIIRNADELDRIRAYINANPLLWAEDTEIIADSLLV